MTGLTLVGVAALTWSWMNDARLFDGQLHRIAAVYENDPSQALLWLHDYRECPIDLRHAAWYYFDHYCRSRLSKTLYTHQREVVDVAFHPQGRLCASVSMDGTIRLWDVAGGWTRSVLQGHEHGATSLTFSPDGQTLVTGGVDKVIKVWDLASGKDPRFRFVGRAEQTLECRCYPASARSVGAVGTTTTLGELVPLVGDVRQQGRPGDEMEERPVEIATLESEDTACLLLQRPVQRRCGP
jgi:WD40 repeat protein